MTAVLCVSVVARVPAMSSNSTSKLPAQLAVAARKHPPGLHRMLNYGREQGKVGWILLWLLGVPIPVLLVLFMIRGCT